MFLPPRRIKTQLFTSWLLLLILNIFCLTPALAQVTLYTSITPSGNGTYPLLFINAVYDVNLNFEELKAGPESLLVPLPTGDTL